MILEFDNLEDLNAYIEANGETGDEIMTGIKHDEGKARWDLMPWNELNEVARVITHGADKYGDKNWTTVDHRRYLAAAMRHIVAWETEETVDTESGLPHLAHAVCSLLFVMALDKGISLALAPFVQHVRNGNPVTPPNIKFGEGSGHD